MSSNSAPKLNGRCEESGEAAGEGDIEERDAIGDGGWRRVRRESCVMVWGARAGDAIDKEGRRA
jgi:hypothetical protein